MLPAPALPVVALNRIGCVPDILATAKGLGGGVPIGAIVARKELTAVWEPGSHGNTFGGNALACAAANEVIDLVQHELAANAARVGAYLMQRLRDLQQQYDVIGDVRGRGLMIGIELVKDRETRGASQFRGEL